MFRRKPGVHLMRKTLETDNNKEAEKRGEGRLGEYKRNNVDFYHRIIFVIMLLPGEWVARDVIPGASMLQV
ncbi:unnamed protein product [Tuber melanosporum]|uniref:(Perigord truffle) hypothetical protein n=1 Tax=Tuber melanosporum (strain Mel28) TaxID=656061 RepID=D5GCP6_TUBMM|nr:uncharacterized protein GSTUM_00005937001 [Tuber melanosporum]CAZ82289.1 unnamed protein product [Tuber melanosporum]